MNCHAWQDLLQQHLDGVAPPEALDQHLLDCPDCAGLRVHLRRLLDGLALLHPPEPPADLADRVTARLCLEARARKTARRLRIASLVSLAAAAVLLLAVGLWSWWPVSGQPVTPTTQPGDSVVNQIGDRPHPNPATPPLRDSVAQAMLAASSLTSRTASDTMDNTSTLLPLVSAPAIDPLTASNSGVEPKLEPLREAADGVSSGLAPVADSARRAVNLFFRDLPMGRGEDSGQDNKPG